jgi:hypothetical protein
MLGLGCLTLTLAGCAGVEVLHEAAFCPGGKEKQILFLPDQAALDTLWRDIRNSPVETAVPRTDFQQRRVLFLADGERPSAGYGLRLANSTLTVASATATLQLETQTPSAISAQVVSRPCLLLALPGGDYRRVEAVDQYGRLWGVAEAAVP